MRKSIMMLPVLLAACASQPEDIGTSYVSPLHYKNFDCEQIGLEAERVSRRVLELRASLKSTADTDALQMGAGLILLWPTLFFLEGGDKAEAVEYSRLKGEREALEKSAVRKKCLIEFPPLEAPKKKEEPTEEDAG